MCVDRYHLLCSGHIRELIDITYCVVDIYVS